jgi:glycosyltransferase involved in cell wall biosynthesis
MMRLGVVVDGHAGFIGDLLSDWRSRYHPEVFDFHEIDLPVLRERLNQWRLRKSLKDFFTRNDIVFFEWAGHFTAFSSQLDAKTPVVVRLHSWELFKFGPYIDWSRIDRVLLVSKAMQQKFVDLYPHHANKTVVISNGVNLSRFSPANRIFSGNIGILCDLVPIKRVYDLILTIYDLKKKGYQWKLSIGGKSRSGPDSQRYNASIRRAVSKLGLQDQIFFHDWVDDTATWLNEQDIFISNSYWEGQQVALLEAMASGCYCLSHFWDGAEEVLPPDYIFITESELQEKLTSFAHLDESEKQQHRSLMRSIACEKFDIERTKARISTVLEEVLAASRK